MEFTSTDRVRDVLHNVNADGFDSLRPKYAGGRPPKFDAGQRAEIQKVALSQPADHGLPFSIWSLSKLADFLIADGAVEDIAHERAAGVGPREGRLLPRPSRPEKMSTDPDHEAKKNQVLELYATLTASAFPAAEFLLPAAVCASCLRPRYASRSCWTASART